MLLNVDTSIIFERCQRFGHDKIAIICPIQSYLIFTPKSLTYLTQMAHLVTLKYFMDSGNSHYHLDQFVLFFHS